VPDLTGRKGPAGQRFSGGVFALSFCDIDRAYGLMYCLNVSALFALRFFHLVFNNWRLWSICIRCYFRLRIRSPALSPTRSLALSPALSRARCPTSASGRHRLVRLVLIFRCGPLRLPTPSRPSDTTGSTLTLPIVLSPVPGSNISALESSAVSALCYGAWAPETSVASTLDSIVWTLEAPIASTWHSGASATSTGPRPTLHHHIPMSKALAAWSHTSTLETLAESTRLSALKIPVKSAGASILPPLGVLIRTLAIRAIWASWSLEILAESTPASALSGLDVLARPLTPWAI
jgi:hypothetical protein